MNIYLHIEISARELDSKLLLATIAAAKGHVVILSDLELILKGLLKGYLEPGIYHTKSLTPSTVKIDRHQALMDKGSIITSIDEESGLHTHGYEKFSKMRYSKKTISQSSAVFCWGQDDFDTLKKNYKEYSNKFYKTGSPRIDICKPFFMEYWKSSTTDTKKPYLLVSSNMGICGYQSFKDKMKYQKENGYFDRIPKLLREQILSESNDYLKALVFIDAIKYLSENNSGYDIIFRPHPSEEIDCWRVLLSGNSNVYVNRTGPINDWINNAFAVMHHGCTTAFEAMISKKPVITYSPQELKGHHFHNQPPNKLGDIIESKEDLLKKTNFLFEESRNIVEKKSNNKFSSQLSEKIYLDDKELAGQKIVKTWESIVNDKKFKPLNLKKVKLFIFKMRVNRTIGNILKKVFPSRFNQLGNSKANKKFPKFDINEINKNVEKFRKILKIEKQLKCELLSDRTIIIKLL